MADTYQQRVTTLETEVSKVNEKLKKAKSKSDAISGAATKACETLQTRVKALNNDLSDRVSSSPLSADVADFLANLTSSVNSAASAMNPANLGAAA